MVLVSCSFNGCILHLMSDSMTLSLESCKIFFNFVLFCSFVCNSNSDICLGVGVWPSLKERNAKSLTGATDPFSVMGIGYEFSLQNEGYRC